VAEPRTIFKGAKKLQPGESLCIRRGQPIPAPKLYWDVRFTLDNPCPWPTPPPNSPSACASPCACA
jgi:hypothetical protein